MKDFNEDENTEALRQKLTCGALARDYLNLDISVFPGKWRGKMPLGKWSLNPVTLENIPNHFVAPCNILGLMGSVSGDLVDIDLDCEEARLIADRHLPPTPFNFGRSGAPSSHRLYRTTRTLKRSVFAAPADGNEAVREHGKVLVEVRGDKTYTVLPGSKHPSGEMVSYYCDGEQTGFSPPGDVPVVDADVLLTRVGRLAAACLVARCAVAGQRNTLYLHLCGALLHQGMRPKALRRFVESVAIASKDEERESRLASAEATIAKFEADEQVTGVPKLAELIGGEAVDKVLDWLNLPGSTTREGKPVVCLDDDHGLKPTLDTNADFAEIVAKAAGILLNSNDPPWLFRYGDTLSEVKPSAKGNIRVHSVTTLREAVARRMRVVRSAGKGGSYRQSPQPPDGNLLSALIETDQLHELPELLQVTQVPVVAQDMSISTSAGYHTASKTYLLTNQFEDLEHSRVSFDEVLEAVAWFKRWPLHGFPFDSDASFCHLMCLMLLPFVRGLIPGPTPLHVIEAPTRATGKSLLATFAIGVISDHRYDGGLNENESEVEKTLASILRAGYTHVLFDNAKGKVESACLEKVLTSVEHAARILGHLRTEVFPNKIAWVMTANNAQLGGDLPSRCVSIRLDAELESPEKRPAFKIRSLPSWMRKKRIKTIHMLLMIVRFWIQSESPLYSGVRTHRMGDWASVMGGICQCAGIGGFLENQESFEQTTDSEHGTWTRFFELWWSCFQGKPVHSSDLDVIAFGDSDDMSPRGPLHTDKIDYCKSRQSRISVLGKLLMANKDRVHGGMKLVVITDTRQERTYALREVK